MWKIGRMKQKKCANCIFWGLGFNNIFKKRLTNILISAVNYPWELEREYDKAVWAADIRWKCSEKDILLIEHIFTEQGELKPSSVSLIICGHQKDYVTSFVLSFTRLTMKWLYTFTFSERHLYRSDGWRSLSQSVLIRLWWIIAAEIILISVSKNG